MSGLQDFQAAFVASLLDAGAVGSLAGQAGFSVYRNTVMAGCVDALVANYPTVHRLVGDDWFRAAAREFVRISPPRSGVLAAYGSAFDAFLTSFEPARELPYLPGIAALDRLWTEAHLAGDGRVLDAAELVALGPERLVQARLRPHPAARWATFDAMPIVSLWRRHRDRLPLDDPLEWRGESAVLTRPGSTVRWSAIPEAAVVFMSACAQGRGFAEALDRASHVPPAEGGDDWLRDLLSAGAFTGLTAP